MAETTNSESKDIGSAFDLLGKSYEIVKKHWHLFVFVNIFNIVFAVLGMFGDDKNTANSAAPAWVKGIEEINSAEEIGSIFAVLVVVLVVALFFYAMTVGLSVRVSKGETTDVSQLVADGKKFSLPLLGQLFVSGLIICVGFLLLIIPGIFAIMRLLMAPFVMVNENLGVMDSIKRSNQLAKANSGKVWAVFGVSIVAALISGILSAVPVVGAIAGTLLGMAWSLIIPLRYLQLKKS